MTCIVRGIPIYYEVHGQGKPLLCIHGWPVDHRMMKSMVEPIFCETQYRRIYFDLPGMGKTPATGWIKNADDMLDIVAEFIRAVIGAENFLLLGSSYGGYLSLGLMHKMSPKIDGVALLCPMVDPREDEAQNLPARQIVWQPASLDFIEESAARVQYMDMAVVATPAGYAQWKNAIEPAMEAADMAFLSSCDMWYSPGLHHEISKVVFDKSSCIVTGRQDNSTGYKIAYELVERFPRATFAVMDAAGHLLERDALYRQLMVDWLERVEMGTIETAKSRCPS